MRAFTLMLGIVAFLVGSRLASSERLGLLRKRIRDWFEETHSPGFELRRHFFRRFFDSELISDPGQAKVVAGGVLAIVISLSIMYTVAYFHKYASLTGLDDRGPYDLAVLADFVFLITLTMAITALFTTLQWPSLFPGLRDYMALAGLPLRMRDIFVAKFTALLAFAGLTIAGTTTLPSIALPMMMAGRYAPDPLRQIPGLVLSTSLAGIFIFFFLVTVQGVLLNVLPVRQFHRVSLAVQGVLLSLLLCSFPFVFSIPDLQPYMALRPAWAIWTPPLWFLGVDQMILGHAEPLAKQLAGIAYASVALSAASAVVTYMWSYRRHRTRVIESPASLESTAGSRAWTAKLEDRLIPDSRSLAVFAFIAKSLARSRQHRLILIAFAAIALAVICEGFFSLVLRGQSLRFYGSPAFHQAVIAVPLALSLFILAGLRYLFRLPIELRANWVFRIHEPGQGAALLAGAESFLMFSGVFPVALLTLPAEMAVLGPRDGFLASLLCLFASLGLMEFLLFRMERIPFTSSYFPGKDPPVITVIKYVIASSYYVGVLSTLIRVAVQRPIPTLLLLFLLAAGWLRARTGRLGIRQFARLEFEEFADPEVQVLKLAGD